MIWESITAIMLSLFLTWLILNYLDKRQLNKLRRNYDENGNTGKNIDDNPEAIRRATKPEHKPKVRKQRSKQSKQLKARRSLEIAAARKNRRDERRIKRDQNRVAKFEAKINKLNSSKKINEKK